MIFVVLLALWLWMLSTPHQLTPRKVSYDLSTHVDKGVQGCVEFHATGTVQVKRAKGVLRHRSSSPTLTSPFLQVSLRASCGQSKRWASKISLVQYWYDTSCKADITKQLRAKPFQTPDCGRTKSAYSTVSFGGGWRFSMYHSGGFATWKSDATTSGGSEPRLCLRGAAAATITYAGSTYQVVTDLGKVCA